MSLATLALRICTVMALTGRTDANDRVADSQIRALEDEGESGLSIAVYVDKLSGAGGLADFGAGEGSALLVIEVLVTTRGPDDALGVPYTDGNMEMAIDLVEHQIRRALLDESVVWSRLWRQLVLKQGSYEFERGANKAKGMRLAGREIAISCGLLADPPIGAPLPSFWSGFLAALAAEPDFADVYEKIAATVNGQELASWRQAQAAQALSANGVRGIGVAPPFETIDEEAPTVVAIDLVAGNQT